MVNFNISNITKNTDSDSNSYTLVNNELETEKKSLFETAQSIQQFFSKDQKSYQSSFIDLDLSSPQNLLTTKQSVSLALEKKLYVLAAELIEQGEKIENLNEIIDIALKKETPSILLKALLKVDSDLHEKILNDENWLNSLAKTNDEEKFNLFNLDKMIKDSGYSLIEVALAKDNYHLASFFAYKNAPISVNAMKKALKISNNHSTLLDIFLSHSPSIEHELLYDVPLPKVIEWIDLLVREKKLKKDDAKLINFFTRQTRDTYEIIERLIKEKVIVDDYTMNWASTRELFHLLLDYNTPISDAAIERAASLGYNDVLQKMVKKGAVLKSNAFIGALSGRQTETIDFLIQLKVPANHGEVMLAATENGLSMMQKLIDYGVPLGKGTLRYAFDALDCPMINFMLNKGYQLTLADFEFTNEDRKENAISYLLEIGIPFPEGYTKRTINFKNRELFNLVLENSKVIPRTCFDEINCKLINSLDEEEVLDRVKELVKKGAEYDLHDINHLFDKELDKVANYLLNLIKEENLNFSALSFKNLLKVEPPELINNILKNKNIDFGIDEVLELNDEKLFIEFSLNRLRNEWGIDVTAKEISESIKLIKSLVEKENLLKKLDDTIVNFQYSSLFELLPRAFIIQKIYQIDLREALLYGAKPSLLIWKELFPNFDVPKELEKCSPYGFNVELFKQLRPITLKAGENENHQLGLIHAYKLSILFQTKDEALKYVQSFKTKRPFHDACLFELPQKGIWTISTWREIVKKSGFKIKRLLLLGIASELEMALEDRLPSLEVMNRYLPPINESKKQEIEKKWKGVFEKKKKTDTQLQTIAQAKAEKSKLKTYEEIYHVLLTQQDEEIKKGIQQRTDEELNNLWKEQIKDSYRQVILKAFYDPKNEDRSDSIMKFCEKRYSFLYRLFLKQKNQKEEINQKEELNAFVNFMIECKSLRNKTYEQLFELAMALYDDVPTKYEDFALECLRSGVARKHYDEAIQILENKPKKQDFIPEVFVDGNEIGYPGYIFEKMKSQDPMIFILGKKTSSCQNIDGHSRDVVLHGAQLPYGGFYRLIKVIQESKDKTEESKISTKSKKKKSKEKKNCKRNDYTGQSWAGITQRGELLFDSIENSPGSDHEMIMKFYEVGAKKIIEKNPFIKNVQFGGSGNTPKIHKYPPVKDEFSRIIGYENLGYDSKLSRYILAEQSQDISLNTIGKESIFLTAGIDTYVHEGKQLQGLASDPFTRARFFEKHPKAFQEMMSHPKNPLVEEGYYSTSQRERYGEMFMTDNMIRSIITKKMEDHPEKYQFDHLVFANNDVRDLTKQLKEIDLQEGQNIFISYIEGVHAIVGYAEKRNDKVYIALLDPETPSDTNSSIYTGIQNALNPEKVISFTAKLQIDYYSCATFATKSFMYLGKHGRELFKAIDKEECLELRSDNFYFLKPGKTPSTLLKMSQAKIETNGNKEKGKFTITVDQEVLDEIVSRKKGITLAQYIEQNSKEIDGIKFNCSALLKKYVYLNIFENSNV